MKEVAIFQEKKMMQANTEKAVKFQIASCLPMLAIIYMDHIHIPAGLPNEHVIDYFMSRICFVCQKDFDWLDNVDKNNLTLVQPFYGKHTQIRSLCNTPMQHNSFDRKLVLKQPVGRELALKHLVAKEAKFKVLMFKQTNLNQARLNQMLMLNHIYHHRSTIGCSNHSLACKI